MVDLAILLLAPALPLAVLFVALDLTVRARRSSSSTSSGGAP